MAKKKKRPTKIENVHDNIRAAIKGPYVESIHAQVRVKGRRITQPEYEYVIEHGRREPRKDEFSEEHKSWSYAIRGRTIDDRELRVAVAFRGGLIIVTLIAIGE